MGVTEDRPAKQVDHEPIPISISVGLLLTVDPGLRNFTRLVMVQQQENKLWGIVAGGVKISVGPNLGMVESPREAIGREFFEETAIPDKWLSYPRRLGQIWFPAGNKMKIGQLYSSEIDLSSSATEYSFLKEHNLYDGFEPPNKEEISLVRAFTQDETFELLQTPDRIYKPEFNLSLMKYWLYNQISSKYDPWDGPEFSDAVAFGRYGLNRTVTKIFID